MLDTDAVEINANPKAQRNTMQLRRRFSKKVKPKYDSRRKLTMTVTAKTVMKTCLPTVLRF